MLICDCTMDPTEGHTVTPSLTTRCCTLGTALALTAALGAACGEPRQEDPPDGIDAIQQALSSIDCTESSDTGYVKGSPFSISVVTVDGKKAEVKTANAYYVMAQAASKAGINLKVVSGFRTMAEQTYLYNCYINCNCNNCNLAAKPGYSNHQSGHAMDLNTSASGVLSWLKAHGGTYGFSKTVPSEDWHWEWWGGGPGGGPCGKPTYPQMTIKVAVSSITGQERDLCIAGDSSKINPTSTALRMESLSWSQVVRGAGGRRLPEERGRCRSRCYGLPISVLAWRSSRRFSRDCWILVAVDFFDAWIDFPRYC